MTAYTPDDPPPNDPPPELGLSECDGLGLWRIAVAWWYEHRPDGAYCRQCLRPYPCPTAKTADSVLDTLRRRARRRRI
ncbi:MAG: hypothetical protein ACRDTU_18155 [Micromonosporaceae bacterium]